MAPTPTPSITDRLNTLAIHYDCLSNEQDAETIRAAIDEIKRLNWLIVNLTNLIDDASTATSGDSNG